MHGVHVLSKVVEAREGATTAALKGPLARVFPNVPRQVLAAAETHATVAKALALEQLATAAHSLQILVGLHGCRFVGGL